MLINELIEQAKKGDKEAYIKLLEKFQPLIIAWLKQSKELYQKDREDFESMAKIILYECAIEFQEARGVPFQSFYKMRLYHWYSNFKKRKQIMKVELHQIEDQQEDLQQLIVENEKKMFMNLAIKQLSERERHIILRHLEGFTDEQISSEMKICKKTIQNYRYTIVKKLQQIIQENYEDFSNKIKPCTEIGLFFG